MRRKKLECFDELVIGSLVCDESGPDCFCVTEIGKSMAVVVRHTHISNPLEWSANDEALSSLRDLDRGHVVKNMGSGNEYVIQANYGDYCFAVRTKIISSIDEWKIVLPKVGIEDFDVFARNYGFGNSETL